MQTVPFVLNIDVSDVWFKGMNTAQTNHAKTVACEHWLRRKVSFRKNNVIPLTRLRVLAVDREHGDGNETGTLT